MIDKTILKKLELIVFDLDGTLLNEKGKIGEETFNLVEDLKKVNVKFSFASGRPFSAITNYAELLKINSPVISLDGALISTFPDNKVLFNSFVPDKHVRKAIKYADQYLLKIALCHAESIYYTEHNSLIPDIMEKFGAKYTQVNSYDNFTKQSLEIVITGDYRDAIKYIRDRMSFPYTFGLTTNYYKSHSHKDIYYLEIRKKGSSKGNGLKILSKKLKVNIKNTAVLGDWYNDVSLFETDALKIAMQNAVPEIKKKANFITKKDNNENGVAEFLQMVLESKRS
ncbi:MAG: Cof-type HAD-IIB family hydrolase [Melioribacteraceae bacterium]|nr:Cof-type HAD-IIB family hydrolase [Melioribacteraceae bacterium]